MLARTLCAAPAGCPIMEAVGTPHMPLIVWVNCRATSGATITTEAEGPSDPHILATAPTSPGPVRLKARPSAVTPSAPLLPWWFAERPSVVARVGTSSAATQNAATTDAAVLPAPRARPRPRNQADAQVAHKISPGSTKGTRRRLAQGWSGTVSGCQRTAAEPQQMTASGSAQTRVAPDGARH